MSENVKQVKSVVSQEHHPIQPLKADEKGVVRFKENSIVSFLTEGKLNELAVMNFPREDWVQLAQLIGYSLSGWGTLSYVSDEDWERANQKYTTLTAEPAPLLRLTPEKIREIYTSGPMTYIEFSNAIMDAMDKLNGE